MFINEVFMQVLKDEVKDKIIWSAKEVFMTSGYSGATMRAIADKSGLTVGNLYRYYKNKQSLYEAIMDPAFSKVRQIIFAYRDFSDIGFDVFKMELVQMICQLYEAYRDEIMIVLKGAKGTKYEGAEDFLKQLIVNSVSQIKQDYNGEELPEADKEYTISLITGAFVDIIIRLFKEQDTLVGFKRWMDMTVTILFEDIHKRVGDGYQM